MIKSGDKVVCKEDFQPRCSISGRPAGKVPKEGDINVVVRVGTEEIFGRKIEFITLQGYPQDMLFNIHKFEKVQPNLLQIELALSAVKESQRVNVEEIELIPA